MTFRAGGETQNISAEANLPRGPVAKPVATAHDADRFGHVKFPEIWIGRPWTVVHVYSQN
jgi:hypothetical protein